MKLTIEDKILLKNWGYKSNDFNQIERATNKTSYEFNGNDISLTEVLQILNREIFLSGISRSAFHWSACRQNENGESVYFDSSRLFK